MLSTMTLFYALRTLTKTRRNSPMFPLWRRMFAIVRYEMAVSLDPICPGCVPEQELRDGQEIRECRKHDGRLYRLVTGETVFGGIIVTWEQVWCEHREKWLAVM